MHVVFMYRKVSSGRVVEKFQGENTFHGSSVFATTPYTHVFINMHSENVFSTKFFRPTEFSPLKVSLYTVNVCKCICDIRYLSHSYNYKHTQMYI